MAEIYFKLGFWHILDWQGYDHILFLLVLLAATSYLDWKKVLWLITAFTIGHALTLIFGGLGWVSLPSKWVEFGIAFTIALTGVLNLGRQRKDSISYGVVGLFGLIHGLGFSTFFKAMLSESDSLINVLFFFNIGVEMGQIVFVALILVLNYLFLNVLRGNQKYWNLVLSVFGIVVAVYLMIERIS